MFSRVTSNSVHIIVLALVLSFCCTGLVFAGHAGGSPVSRTMAVSPLTSVPVLTTDALDVTALLQEDIWREEQGLPYRYALPQDVHISPEKDGSWENLSDGSTLWRLRVANPGAESLNLGFTRFDLPYGVQLFIYAADERGSVFTFDAEDNRTHQELWTPIMLTDEVVVELVVPSGKKITEENLTLGVVGCGYVEFGSQLDKAGDCNIDVVCAEGDDWRVEIRAEAVYSTGGSTFCSGSMINNTAQDGRPLFLTANHCSVTASNAPSVVVYWNYESENCGDLGGGSMDQFTSGGTLLASYYDSDMKLVELDDYPDPAFGVTYAGWDRTDADPLGAVAIHSPGADEKMISFEHEQTTTTTYLQDPVPGNGTHIRVESWNLGTTEGGSSGSPLFNLEHRIVGQLHGGYASCTDDRPDWYGRLSVSWEGGGAASSRLRDWLDPLGTGVTILDTYDPGVTGLAVTPDSDFAIAGNPGGPFSPLSQAYLLENSSDAALNFTAITSVEWLSISPGSGSIAVGESVEVVLSLSAVADTMSIGYYDGEVHFSNTTTGDGSAVRNVELTVGQRESAVIYTMDQDPVWSMDSAWSWGVPTGQGGEYGGADPTAGSTGNNVLGYNLTGDYTNGLSEQHLTTRSVDCRGLSSVHVRFQRWLGVEASEFDHASLSVSNNGTDFHQVWANPYAADITDSEWTQVEYDISTWADDNATVTLRWTMGATDGSFAYCGWNIDDVELLAFGESSINPEPEPDDTGSIVIQAAGPNPFAEEVTVFFTSDSSNEISARVLNLHGAVVAQLGSRAATVGENSWTWDGTGADGRRLSSGLYIVEIYSSRHGDRIRVVFIH